jgi:hypothetical protein
VLYFNLVAERAMGEKVLLVKIHSRKKKKYL